MSRGQVGKNAASDMAADVVIKKLLDLLAVHQPQLWEQLRRTVTPHLNVAHGGMIVGAEVMALLKDNLRFLPDWAHQILDLGLEQAPMSVASYFRLHQVRDKVLGQVGQSPANFDPDTLANELTQEIINSPQFKQMAEDAALGSIMRRVQAFQEAMEKSAKADFRLPLLGKFRQAYEVRQPERDETDDNLVTTFGLWVLRQNESVSVLLAHLLEASPSVAQPLNLFTRDGLKRFMDQSEPDRLTTLATMGRPLNVAVSTAAVEEPLGDDEPEDPGERYLHRQRGFANLGNRFMEEDLAKYSGEPTEIVRLFRETYEAVNGPCNPEQLEKFNQMVVKISPLDFRRRRSLEHFMHTGYDAYVTKTATVTPKEDKDMREKTYIPGMIDEMAEGDPEMYEALADKVLLMLEATTMVLGHAMSNMVGSVEAITGDDKKKRGRP